MRAAKAMAALAWCLLVLPGSSASAQPALPRAERLLIDKSDRTLTIFFEGGGVVTLARLRFGRGWNHGPKRQQGDGRTPEGEYRVLEHRTSRTEYPDVVFLPALYLDYPNADDLAAAEALGVDPGGAIMIHGPHPDFPSSELRGDWTEGCAALDAAQIHYLMRHTGVGTPVTIRP